MKSFAKHSCLVGISTFLLLSLAVADVDSFDAHCADLQTLMVKSVQHEIGLSEAQRAKMNVFADAHAKKVNALAQKDAGKKNVDERRKLFDYLMELKTQVLGVLSPTQLKRLREICLQRVGLLALCDPIVATRVGLSDAQVKKLRTTYDQGLNEFQTVQKAAADKVLAPYRDRHADTDAQRKALDKEIEPKIAAARTAIAPKLDAIKSRYDVKMRAILTPGQLKIYEALRGRPFKPS